MTPAVVATGLVKEFEKGRHTVWQRLRGRPDQRTRFRAVDGIDLRVETGEIFGLLGPNGAGKTTTIRLLLDLIRPTSGRLSVFGLDSRRDSVAIRRRLGYLPGDLRLYERLTAREHLRYFASLRGMRDIGDGESLAERLELELDLLSLVHRRRHARRVAA